MKTILVVGLMAAAAAWAAGCTEDQASSDAADVVDAQPEDTPSELSDEGMDQPEAIEDAGPEPADDAPADEADVPHDGGEPDPCLGADCSGHGTCHAIDGVPFCRCSTGYLPRGLLCETIVEEFDVGAVEPAAAPPGARIEVGSDGVFAGRAYSVLFGDAAVAVPAIGVVDGRLAVLVPLLPPGVYALRLRDITMSRLSGAVDFEVSDFAAEPIPAADLVSIVIDDLGQALTDIEGEVASLEAAGESPLTPDQAEAFRRAMGIAEVFFRVAADFIDEASPEEARLMAGALQEAGILDVLDGLRIGTAGLKYRTDLSYRRSSLFLTLDTTSFLLGNVNAVLGLVKVGCWASVLSTGFVGFGAAKAISAIQAGIGLAKDIIDVVPTDLQDMYVVDPSGTGLASVTCPEGGRAPIDFVGDFQGEKSPAESAYSLTVGLVVDRFVGETPAHLGRVQAVKDAIGAKLLEIGGDVAAEFSGVSELLGSVRLTAPREPLLIVRYEITLLDLMRLVLPVTAERPLEDLLHRLGIDPRGLRLVSAVESTHPENVGFDIDLEEATCLRESAGNALWFQAFRFEERSFVVGSYVGWDVVSGAGVAVRVDPAPAVCGDGVLQSGEECDGDLPRVCTTSCLSEGLQSCVSCAWGSCEPPTDVCNGSDDDCDTVCDNGFACCSGEVVACIAPGGFPGSGTCTAACAIPTDAACAPVAETCNGADDDADTVCDNGFACCAGAPVGCTTTCGSTGTGTCTASCAIPGTAGCVVPPEVCNGVDDDCDTFADNVFTCGLGSSESCTTACGTVGTRTCGTACTWGACCAATETCGNGCDDDCDGSTDESCAADVLKIAAGEGHACALMADGQVWCWGRNASGQLGNGTSIDRLTPAVVPGVVGATDLCTGWSFTCALLTDSSVRCWGENSQGQLGDGTTTNRLTPVSVSGLSGAAQVACGAAYACTRQADDTARCWGYNACGQLGDGTTTNRLTPVPVSGLAGVAQISCGGEHTCTAQNDTTARCWGCNWTGELGDGTTNRRLTPVPVSGLTGATQVACHSMHTCTVQSDGTARCWGYNGWGELGDGTTSISRTPVPVSGLTGATQVACGRSHTCARRADGTLRCWGLNADGQLGDGTTTDSLIPVGVSALSDAGQVACGSWFTCTGQSDGSARCWGANASGQLGDGTTTDRWTPVDVLF